MSLTLRIGAADRLAQHVARQLAMLYPLSDTGADQRLLEVALPAALRRMEIVVASVNSFAPGRFDHFNTLQYASFLYLLANELHHTSAGEDIVDRLFALNKMISGLELYPAVELPLPFFLSHALGAVLGNVGYGSHLVVFQNVTVGRIGDRRPTIGDRVILFAGAAVTGSSEIGPDSVIAAGVQVHNAVVPAGSLVTAGPDGLRIASLERDYHSLYFRTRGA